jgi:hypothetical protein
MKTEYFAETPPTSVARGIASARQRSKRTSSQVFLGGILAVVFLLILLAVGLEFSLAVPLAILFALTLGHFISLLTNPGADLFSPVLGVALYFTVDIGLRAIYVSPLVRGRPSGLISFTDELPVALWCALLAYCSFILGFHSRWPGRSKLFWPKGQFTWPANVKRYRVAILLAVGMAATLYLLKIGAMTAGVERVRTTAPPPGIIVALLREIFIGWAITVICFFVRDRQNRQSPGWLPVLALSTACILANVAITGGKQALFEPMLEALIIVHYLKKRLRVWQLVGIGFAAMILGFGALNFYRFAVVEQATAPKGISDIADRVSTAGDRLQSGSTGRESAFDQMLERQAGIDALALVMQRTPDPIPFAYGESILRAASAAFIPRQVWPDKPLYTPSREYEHDYMGMPSTYDGHASPHLVADHYHNLWLPGVVLGMGLFGGISRSFYRFCSPGPGTPVGVFIYAIFLPDIFHYLEGNIGYAIVELPRIVLVVALSAAFIGVRYSRRGMVASAVVDGKLASGRNLQHA